MRKTNLARLLARRVDGIHLADFEQGEIGPDLSATPACGRAVAHVRGSYVSETDSLSRLLRSASNVEHSEIAAKVSPFFLECGRRHEEHRPVKD